MSRLMNLCACALLSLGVLSIGSVAFGSDGNIQTLSPQLDPSGRATVRVPAMSIYQYTPMILCDSNRFRMSHFSSFYQQGTLIVELRYVVRNQALGTSCTVFFVEDLLEEFDFGSGEALSSAPQSFRFVIR